MVEGEFDGDDRGTDSDLESRVEELEARVEEAESAQSEGARSAVSAGLCRRCLGNSPLLERESRDHSGCPARAAVLVVRGVLRRDAMGPGEVLLATSPNAALSAGELIARYPIPQTDFLSTEIPR
jgi:hypothetical protein